MDTTVLTLPEAAKRLRATVYFVRTIIADGEIPYVKIGKKFCVTSGDLDKWVERNRQYAGDENREILGQENVKRFKSIG